jgi:hypothetical protein
MFSETQARAGSLGALVATLLLASGGAAYAATSGARTADPIVNAQAQAAAESLTQFLLRPDEEPGFSPAGRVRSFSSLSAFVKFAQGTQAYARRLRTEGFVSFTYQPVRSPSGPGTTNVTEFVTASGARRETSANLGSIPSAFRGWKIRRFGVAGVPSAHGFTASRGKVRVGNVLWIEGRCELILGNAGSAPFIGPESAAVRSIHQRTHGRCP